MLTACSDYAAENNKNVLTSISFGENLVATSLSAEIEGPSVSNIYWRYTAELAEQNGPFSGRTGFGVANSNVLAGTEESQSRDLVKKFQVFL